MRALARGPSGTLMQSIPLSRHSRAPAISLDASMPRGGRISTKETNLPAASFAPSCDFSAMGTFGRAFTGGLPSSAIGVAAALRCTGCSERIRAITQPAFIVHGHLGHNDHLGSRSFTRGKDRFTKLV